MVKNWVTEFKGGRASTVEEHRLYRPVEMATPDIVDHVHEVVVERQTSNHQACS